MKQECCICGKEKSLDKFYRDNGRVSGVSSRCIKCSNEATKVWMKENRFKRALYMSVNTANKKGFAPCNASVSAIKNAFNGKCHICGANEGDHKRGLHLDHCHRTGKFRGWLCSKCNQGLGLFGENVETMEKATEYIKHIDIQDIEKKG